MPLIFLAMGPFIKHFFAIESSIFLEAFLRVLDFALPSDSDFKLSTVVSAIPLPFRHIMGMLRIDICIDLLVLAYITMLSIKASLLASRAFTKIQFSGES